MITDARASVLEPDQQQTRGLLAGQRDKTVRGVASHVAVVLLPEYPFDIVQHVFPAEIGKEFERILPVFFMLRRTHDARQWIHGLARMGVATLEVYPEDGDALFVLQGLHDIQS